MSILLLKQQHMSVQDGSDSTASECLRRHVFAGRLRGKDRSQGIHTQADASDRRPVDERLLGIHMQ